MTHYIYNLSKENMLLDNVLIANSFFSRLKGLLGRQGLEKGQCLVIRPCNSIHTFGMQFPIDVAFIDKNNKVIYIIENMPEGRISPIVKGSSYVVEAGSGHFKDKDLALGDIVEISVFT